MKLESIISFVKDVNEPMHCVQVSCIPVYGLQGMLFVWSEVGGSGVDRGFWLGGPGQSRGQPRDEAAARVWSSYIYAHDRRLACEGFDDEDRTVAKRAHVLLNRL